MEKENFKLELAKPLDGWSNLFISDKDKKFFGSLSYVDEVPFMFLETVYNKLTEKKDQVIRFDEEGSEFILVITDIGIYTISDRKEIKADYFFINEYDLAEMICDQIKLNIDDWSSFTAYGETQEELDKEIENNKKELIELIEKIETLINKRKEDC